MNTKTFTKVSMIAAVYTVLSMVLAPLSFGPIQIRVAEAMTVLPLIYRPSIFGVTLGCFLTNLLGAITGVNPTGFLDAAIGTAATFLAAVSTYRLRNVMVKKVPVPALLMPVVFNFVFIGAELAVLLMPETVFLGTMIFGAEVAIGELASVILGWLLVNWSFVRKIFKDQE